MDSLCRGWNFCNGSVGKTRSEKLKTCIAVSWPALPPRPRRLHPAEILESSNIRAAAALAANGYGIGFLSGELLEHLNNAVPFNAFPLRDCTLSLESVAAWRAGNYLPRYALAFIERMEQLENQKLVVVGKPKGQREKPHKNPKGQLEN